MPLLLMPSKWDNDVHYSNKAKVYHEFKGLSQIYSELLEEKTLLI